MLVYRLVVRLLITVGLVNPVLAMQKVNLYNFSIPASSSGDIIADQRSAFDRVLIRLTGNQETLSNPTIAKARQHAGDFLQQYVYRKNSALLSEKTLGSVSTARRLDATFNQRQIEKILNDAGVYLWGDRRPLLIIWYVDEDRGQKKLIADDSPHAQILRQQADSYALPVILPIIDLDDLIAVSVTDIWGGFEQPMVQASQRYGADMALTVKHYQSNNGSFNDQWKLLNLSNHQQFWQGLAQGTDDGVDALLWEQVSDRLSAWFSKGPSSLSNDSMLLTFDKVNSLSRYLQVESFLTNQPSLTGVTLRQVQGNSYTFSLQLQSAEGWSNLQHALSLDQNFQLKSQLLHH